MTNQPPEIPSPREVLTDTIEEQLRFVQPRSFRYPGIADPDESVRAGSGIGADHAIDTEATKARIRRRILFLAAFSTVPIALIAVGIDSLASSGNREPLFLAWPLSIPFVLYANDLAQIIRILKHDRWHEWPAAQMLVDTSRLPWYLQTTRVKRWMVQLFNFDDDCRFLVASSWFGMLNLSKFARTPGRVWVAGDPNGRLVIAVDGGDWPTLFNARFLTTQRSFIEQEFSAQFPPGRPQSWPVSPLWQYPAQVEYKGPIVWPKPPGKTGEWDHESAEKQRSVPQRAETGE